jgi:hypothetical protein
MRLVCHQMCLATATLPAVLLLVVLGTLQTRGAPLRMDAFATRLIINDVNRCGR